MKQLNVREFNERMDADAHLIVECILDGQVLNTPFSEAEAYRDNMLVENPQVYPGDYVYLKDTKFGAVSVTNIESYTLLFSDENYCYYVNPMYTQGYVFFTQDIVRKDKKDRVPVLRVFLRDSVVKDYKQAHGLRIRQSQARSGVATNWYKYYVRQAGGVVSDFEHLTGGKTLWRSLVNRASDREMKASLVDTTTGEWFPAGSDTPDDVIWSSDPSKKHLVLVLERV